MLLLFFSDLHLDASFLGHTSDDARQRRQILRDTFTRICDIAVEVKADAVCCGGDLYEQESIAADAGEFLRDGFAGLGPMPVLLAPGDRDPWFPDSLYAQVGWSPNVRVFTEPVLSRARLTDGLTIWGGAHHAPPGEPRFFDPFWARGDGIHIALFHGTERGVGTERIKARGYGVDPTVAPFSAEAIPAAGLHHALVGHIHDPHDAENYTYAGNPAPLSADDPVKNAIVLVTVHRSGSVLRRRRAAFAPAELVGMRVVGDPPWEAPGEDREAIARERSVRGQFVRDVRAASELSGEERERVLDMGLRALAGSTDLEVR